MNIIRTTLAAVALALSAAAANAVDIGDCAVPEAMTAKLKAEDQHSIVTAQRIMADKRLFGIIVTMSTDRSTGYILQSNQPGGDRAGQFCVNNRLAKIRLFDARKPGTPPGVLLKAPEADAARRCDELAAEGKVKPRGSCGSLNTMIRRVEANGDRVILQAFATAKQADGSHQPIASLVTISGNVTGGLYDDLKEPLNGILGGILYSSLPDGATVIHATLVFPRYTSYGLDRLN